MSGTTSAVDASYLERAAELLGAPKRAGLEASVCLGGRVLDVGCGPGIDTVALARLIGVDGEVDGVDADPAMVAAADRRAAEAGLDGRVRHHVARADALPFADATFHTVRAERLVQHAVDAPATVREMVRVTRRGGTVVLVDTDWTSLSVAGDEPAIERRIVAELCALVPTPTAGRDLRSLLVRAGCAAVEVRPFVAALTSLPLARLVAQLDAVEARAVAGGRLSEDELARWRASCEALDEAGAFYGQAVMNVAIGRVPR
jgi:SAM-dependent methyltransferase